MNTRTPHAFAQLIEDLRRFIDEEVIPREDLKTAHDSTVVGRLADELYAKARARGLGAPRARLEDGGLALSWTECCGYMEEAGRSFLGPQALRHRFSRMCLPWNNWPRQASVSATSSPCAAASVARASP